MQVTQMYFTKTAYQFFITENFLPDPPFKSCPAHNSLREAKGTGTARKRFCVARRIFRFCVVFSRRRCIRILRGGKNRAGAKKTRGTIRSLYLSEHAFVLCLCARDRSRTCIPLRVLPPQGSASAISPPAHIVKKVTNRPTPQIPSASLPRTRLGESRDFVTPSAASAQEGHPRICFEIIPKKWKKAIHLESACFSHTLSHTEGRISALKGGEEMDNRLPGSILWISAGGKIGEFKVSLNEMANASFRSGQRDADRGYASPRQNDRSYLVGFYFYRQRASQRIASRMYPEPFDVQDARDLDEATKMLHAALATPL